MFPGGDGDEDGYRYLCVDEDAKVRFWRRIVAQPPSDIPEQGGRDVTADSVDISTLPVRSADQVGSPKKEFLAEDSESWAEKGAALWT